MDGFWWDLFWIGVGAIALILLFAWLARTFRRIRAALAAFFRSRGLKIAAIAVGATVIVAYGIAMMIPNLLRSRSSIDSPSAVEPAPTTPPPIETGSPPRTSPPPPIPTGPVYNATVSHRSTLPAAAGSEILAVADRKPNSATFWVGLLDPASALRENNEPSPDVGRHVGSATVSFQCLACSNQQPQEAEMTLTGLESTRLEFPFVPDRTHTKQGSGAGLLVFTVSVASTPIDRVTVPLLVGSPTESAVATYRTLADEAGVTPVSSLKPVDRGIDLQITFYEREHYLALDMKPISSRLRSRLLGRGWSEFAMQGVTTSFAGAMSENTLENKLIETYRRLNTLMRAPDSPELRQAIARISGSEPQLKHVAHLTASEERKLVSDFAEIGESLFAVIATEASQSNEHGSLEEFLHAITDIADGFRQSGPPLRVQVRNSTQHYVPWQLLYVRQLGPGIAASSKWFFGTLAEVAEDRVPITSIQPVRALDAALSGSHILYGRWTAVPEDTVSIRAGNLQDTLKNLVQDPDNITVVTSRDALLRALSDSALDLRLITIYAHGEVDTSIGGPVLKLNTKEYVTPDQIRRAAPRIRGRPSRFPLVILASCELGTGGDRPMDDDDFPATFLRSGSGAVVAPISEIWAAYAEWFARDVAAFLASGSDIQSAVHRTRLKHMNERRNPAGLLFSVFGDPALRTTTRATATAGT